MKQVKRLLCAVTLATSLILHAQGEGRGIHWTTGLSWDQIKQKAKAENKYIFVDAYATWCGPCKMMDKNVYPNDTVGDFFNRNFIPVKVQMDVTDKDDQNIKAWYKDASTIGTECIVSSFPTFIFFSPDGKIVQKESRYFSVQEFVALGKEALTPGKTYDDEYPQYKRFVNDYKQGIKHFDQIPHIIKIAGKLNDTAFARQLFKEHLEYASRLNEAERYTKENIQLWSSFVLKLDSKALRFFIKDHDQIDRVMNQKGYSTNVVDNTIQKRIVDSFFRMQKGVTKTVTGENIPNSGIMFRYVPVRKDGKIKPDYVEADWKTLTKMIREHFSEDYAGRNLFYAKSKWYDKHQNKTSYTKNYFDWIDKHPPTDLAQKHLLIGEMAWETFLFVNDKKRLNKALEWMDKILKYAVGDSRLLDTYANLLYKLGHTKEAIIWQEKAVQNQEAEIAGKNVTNVFKLPLEKMKKGEPTYEEQGAIWPKQMANSN